MGILVRSRMSNFQVDLKIAPAAPPRVPGAWEEFVSQGAELKAAKRGLEWAWAQLMAQLETRYGGTSFEQFAREMGESHLASAGKRYSLYARVWRCLGALYTENPLMFGTLSFTHAEVAVRHDDPAAYLLEAADKGWTIGQMKGDLYQTHPDQTRDNADALVVELRVLPHHWPHVSVRLHELASRRWASWSVRKDVGRRAKA